jgi:N-acetylglucosaminyl-diphospho-decaprenol L-rhamnosyltransferase
MHVVVIIVSYRNPLDVISCVLALNAQSHSDFEVIICENGGDEFERRLREMLPKRLNFGQNVHLIGAPSNPGFAGSVNACVARFSTASAWWILNPDAEPLPTSLEFLLSELNDGRINAVGCTLLLPSGRIQSQGGLWKPLLGRAVSIGNGLHLRSAIPQDRVLKLQNYLNGASILVDTKFVATVGLMREDYFLYCEEVEWFLRALTLGLNIGYAHESIVIHKQGTTTGAGGQMRKRSKLSVYLNSRNSLLLTRDLYPHLVPITALLSLIYIFAKYMRSLAFKQFIFAVEGWAAGIQNQRGKPPWLA